LERWFRNLKIPIIEKVNNKINRIIKKFDDVSLELNSSLKETADSISKSMELTSNNLTEVSKSFLETAQIISTSLQTTTENLNEVAKAFLKTTQSLEKT